MSLSRLTTVSVFIVDIHLEVRRGLIEMIEHHPDLTVVGQAATAAEDSRLPDGSGIDLCRDLLAQSDKLRCLIWRRTPMNDR